MRRLGFWALVSLTGAFAHAEAPAKTPGVVKPPPVKATTNAADAIRGTVGPQLSLEIYLNQVREKNGAFRASQNIKKGASLYAAEGGMLFSPQLFANIGFSDDKRPPGQPNFQGDETLAKSYSLGVSKQTRFGMVGKLYYQLIDIDIKNIPPTFMRPGPHYYTASPVLELSQSLWRNGLGSEIRAAEEVAVAQARANEFMESFKARTKLMEAEMAYFRLVSARKAVDVQKELVDRARRIVDWASRRARLNLGDRADSLQAESALQLRQLDLQSSVDEHRMAARALNVLRGMDADDVSESLDTFNSTTLVTVATPTRSGLREDIQASEYLRRLSEASAQMAKEKVRPTLDVSGSVSLNSRELSSSDATSKSFSGDYPYYTVQLKFSAPLDFGGASDVKEGRNLEVEAAKLNYDQKVRDAESEWVDLTQRLDEAKARLKMTEALAQTQQSKMNYERDRLMRGRTTSYQVILFEQEYASSEFARLRAQNDVLRTLAQMKLFGGERQ